VLAGAFGSDDFGVGLAGAPGAVDVDALDGLAPAGPVLVEPAPVVSEAAEAPAMPAAVPPVAIAPATIVAPSILEILMVLKPPGVVDHRRHAPAPS
jgi:hypothetical protein